MESWLWYLLPGLVTYVVTGQPSSLPYMPKIHGQCTNNTTEYFETSVNLCCRKCVPGTRHVRKCTTQENTLCEECPSDMYTDSFNYFKNCFTCTKCDDEKGTQYDWHCSKDRNARCVCKPGWFCLFDYELPACSECQEYRKCPPGKGATLPMTLDSDVQCVSCPKGTFSDESSSQLCKPHTRCESQGRSVLHPGTTTSDTVCGGLVAATTSPVVTRRFQTTIRTTPKTPALRGSSTTNPTLSVLDLTAETSLTSSTSSNTLSSRSQETNFGSNLIGLLVVPALLILIAVAFTVWMCQRKGTLKPALDDISERAHGLDTPQICGSTECQGLLPEGKTDPSTSSSDNQSQSTGISQDCIHMDQPSVSSPCVSLSITATFNCQVNPATGACTIPISSCLQQQPEPDFPLSQEEELCKSCEQEDGKSALQSVQESGLTVC